MRHEHTHTHTVGGKATVTVRAQEKNIVSKDMEEVTTKDDVLNALIEEVQIDGLPETAIRSQECGQFHTSSRNKFGPDRTLKFVWSLASTDR